MNGNTRNANTRREFLANVGAGMFVAGLGPVLACELGLSPAFADDGSDNEAGLTFGPLEPLVDLMQQTPADRLLHELVSRLQSGTDLRQLTAAAALANARTFGGEHYRGYHAFMAIVPAYQIAMECPEPRRALPVLKVLYRNSEFIQSTGGNEVLHPVTPAELRGAARPGELLREANRQHDAEQADRVFAAMASTATPEESLNDILQFNVEDHASVHEVVLVWRAWALLDFTGREHAHTLLRQSVRQCIGKSQKNQPPDPRPALLAKLLDEYRLPESATGKRSADDRWVESMCRTILAPNEAQAAEAVAAALAEGFKIEDVGEAISLAANQLVLRQVDDWEGRMGTRTHGDSPGVHSSDAVNAWRNIARVSNVRNAAAAMILAGYFVAGMHKPSSDPKSRGHDAEPYPHPDQLERIRTSEAGKLLSELDGAIRENDQLRACALAQKYSTLGHDPRGAFGTLRRYAISEDGRLHGEKYYRTVAEEFATARPAFRSRHLVSLARVTASSYGYDLEDRVAGRAPGYAEACRLLKVDA